MTEITRKRSREGFTLIELMIIMAIISILLSIAMPKYAEFMLKSQEGQTKGNLGSLRSALNLYYSDNGGVFPACDTAGANSGVFNDMAPKYIPAIPPVNNGLHPPNPGVYCDQAMVGGSVHDGQGWYFDGLLPTDALNGTLWVACDHDDSINLSWTSY